MINRTSYDEKGRVNGSISLYDRDKFIKAVETVLEREEFPLIEDVAMEFGVTYRTILDWRRTHPEINPYLEEVETKQRAYLQKGAVSGNTNVIGSIFLLKANHGMVDQPKKDEDTNINVNLISYKDEAQTIADETTKAKSIALDDELKSESPSKK